MLTNADTNDIVWYEEGNPIPIGTGPRVHVTIDPNIHYYVGEITVSAQNGGCAASGTTGSMTFRDTSWVTFGTEQATINQEICEGEAYSFLGRLIYKSGTYDTLFSTKNGCDSIITLHLTVNPLPAVALDKTEEIDLCEGDSLTLSVLFPNANTTTYRWEKDGNDIPGGNQASIRLTESGTYRLFARTNKGCEASSSSVHVSVHPLPDVAIDNAPTELFCSYDTISLSVANPAPRTAYVWTPQKPFLYGTGNEGTDVSGVFLQPTEVTLTAHDRYGCNNAATTFVMTEPCCEVFIPNAFTPNLDGVNDYFKPIMQTGQLLTTMRIYNRLGQLVYDNNNNKKGWDGMNLDGKPVASDTYMYFIEYTCLDGNKFTRKGSISLLR